jgi:hypothetical protein
MMAPVPESKNALLRHTVATLAYRGGKALRGAPPEFAAYRVAPGTRAPGEILAHICDLLDWGRALADGKHVWHNSVPQAWDADVARFFTALEAFDTRLASGAPLGSPCESLFQGPIADAFTHIGQISMLRRLAGSPVRGENYFKAEIAAGRVGPEQAKPNLEFD